MSSVTQPAHGTVTIGAGGNVTYTPDANYNGPDSFTYTVTSGGVTETTTVSVTVVPVNDPLAMTVPAAQTTNEDTPRVFSSANGNAITVTDIDGDTISMTVSATNGLLTLGSVAGVTVTGNGTGTVTLVWLGSRRYGGVERPGVRARRRLQRRGCDHRHGIRWHCLDQQHDCCDGYSCCRCCRRYDIDGRRHAGHDQRADQRQLRIRQRVP